MDSAEVTVINDSETKMSYASLCSFCCTYAYAVALTNKLKVIRLNAIV